MDSNYKNFSYYFRVPYYRANMTADEFSARSGDVTPDGKTESMKLTVKSDPTAPNTGLGGADSQYGKRFRRVNDGLSTCGISHLIDTPKIAIMGSQSAGKSSVMESISKIPFPRSSGTCTRCPTEVRLYNKQQDWTCTVSLRIENDAQGHPLPKPKVIPFGKPLSDLSLVQQRISAAQRAILNPNKSAQSFINDGASEEENEISFSENTICLDVRGNDLVDLTIIDLPGIIANTGDGDDANSIELIKSLVRKTITKPNCLILSTITMSEDFQNQSGVTLAKEADPEGTRTLGVLTKPDRIGDGDFEQWTPLLKGQVNRLLQGYYVVKNPSSEELKKKLTHKETRANEAAFFQQEPWRSLGAVVASRLGSQKLAQRLETLLEKLIQDKLPQTIAQIHSMSQETNDKLCMLPVKVTNEQAKQELFAVCQNFSQIFQKVIENDDIDQPVLFGWPLRTLITAFRDKAYKSRPILLPYTEPEMTTSDCLSDDEDKGDIDCESVDSEAGLEVVKGVPQSKAAAVNEVTAGAKLLTKSDPEPFRVTLDLIKDAMDAATRDRLPGNVPFVVKERLMKQAIEPLGGFARDLFSDVVTLLKRVATTLVSNHLQKKYESRLPDAMLNSLMSLIDHQAEFCQHLIAQLIATEHGLVFTLNSHYYVDKRNDFCKRLCQQRIERKLHGDKVVSPYNDGASDKTIVKFLQKQNIPVQRIADLAEYRIPAEIKERIMLAAEVRAYWQVAFKRFIDNVCATIHVHLINPIGKRCFLQMCEDLGVLGGMTADKATKLLQHPESVRQEREDLEASKQRLDSALKVIEDFHHGRYDQ